MLTIAMHRLLRNIFCVANPTVSMIFACVQKINYHTFFRISQISFNKTLAMVEESQYSEANSSHFLHRDIGPMIEKGGFR